jgi:hypothetical protein
VWCNKTFPWGLEEKRNIIIFILTKRYVSACSKNIKYLQIFPSTYTHALRVAFTRKYLQFFSRSLILYFSRCFQSDIFPNAAYASAASAVLKRQIRLMFILVCLSIRKTVTSTHTRTHTKGLMTEVCDFKLLLLPSLPYMHASDRKRKIVCFHLIYAGTLSEYFSCLMARLKFKARNMRSVTNIYCLL